MWDGKVSNIPGNIISQPIGLLPADRRQLSSPGFVVWQFSVEVRWLIWQDRTRYVAGLENYQIKWGHPIPDLSYCIGGHLTEAPFLTYLIYLNLAYLTYQFLECLLYLFHNHVQFYFPLLHTGESWALWDICHQVWPSDSLQKKSDGQSDGTGLGMWLVRQIIRLNGGSPFLTSTTAPVLICLKLLCWYIWLILSYLTYWFVKMFLYMDHSII